MNEDEFIRAIKTRKGDSIKYFAMDLLRKSYDSQLLVSSAKREDCVQELGYLSDVARDAAIDKGLPCDTLVKVVQSLENCTFNEWRYLDPELAQWAKELISEDAPSPQSLRWKIYSRLKPEDIADWIDIYITQDYAATSRR